MSSDSPRITGPTLKVLREVLSNPLRDISGAEISRTTGLPSGTLYPILFRLEKHGWLCSRWEESEPSDLGRPRRRLYRLTAPGEARARAAFREYLPVASEVAWQG